MLNAARQVLSFDLKLIEWLVLALAVAVPYLAVGVAWTIGHGDRFVGLDGVDLATSILGAIVSWPVLLVAPPACVPG